jgi:murein L,D-transpeptidase YcbB/YkuD
VESRIPIADLFRVDGTSTDMDKNRNVKINLKGGRAILPQGRTRPVDESGARPKRVWKITVFLGLFVWAVLQPTAGRADLPGPLLMAEAIQDRLAEGIPSFYCQVELPRFYTLRQYMPAWVTPEGVQQDIPELLRTIRDSALEGLHPGDYHLDAVEQNLNALTAAAGSDAPLEAAVNLELLLTDAYLLLGSHFTAGRINPESIDAEWFANRRQGDLPGHLEEALAAHAVRASLLNLLPRYEGYRRLKATYRRYRQLAQHGAWPRIPEGGTLQIGDHDARVPLLRERLAMGSEPPPAAEDRGDFFDAELAQRLKRFQVMHGLEADGRLGRRTLAALNTPLEARLEQIAANLERWRWLPEDLGERYLLVNIADYHLDVVEKNVTVMRMGVIVGKPYRHTPVFSGDIRYLVFNPSWTVPLSIALRDKLPLIRKDPSYLAKQGMRLLDARGKEKREIDPRTVDWSKVGPANFPYTLFQPPGPDNALGRVKFMFPNRFNVYLHDTPNRELFAKTARNFSSGCIRLEHPVQLAAYVLRDQDGWDRRRIEDVLEAGRETTVVLKRRLPVHLLYWTVFIDAEGNLCFREDIYGRDRRLVDALNQSPP